jgi:hypothetical protein
MSDRPLPIELAKQMLSVLRPIGNAVNRDHPVEALLQLMADAFVDGELTFGRAAIEQFKVTLKAGWLPLESLLDDDFTTATPLSTVKAISDLSDLITGLSLLPIKPDSDVTAEQAARRLLDHLVGSALRQYHPSLYSGLILLKLASPPDPHTERSFVLHSDRLARWISKPAEIERDLIGWDTPSFDPDVYLSAFTMMLDYIGIASRLEEEQPACLEPDLTFTVPVPFTKAAYVHAFRRNTPSLQIFGLRLQASPASQLGDDAGFAMSFYGNAKGSLEAQLGAGGDWLTRLDVSGQIEGSPFLSIRPAATRVVEPSGSVLNARLGAGVYHEKSKPALSLLSTDVLKVSAGHPELELVVEAKDDNNSVVLNARIVGGEAVIQPTSPDGLLAMLLPEGGVRAVFDVSARLSSRDGLSFEGSAGLDIDIPLTVNIFDGFSLDTLHLRCKAEQSAIIGEVSVTGSGQVGPFLAVVERMGIDIAISAGGGMPGQDVIARIAGVTVSSGFRPPTGVALGLEIGPLSGGGFLSLDAAAGRYAGALALTVEALALSAFGVISTRMPDGSDGFSMLAFIRGQFPPVPLGFGFTLNSVGGLLGINRDLNSDALFGAVRFGAIGKLLAPENPLRDASSLIAQAEAIFPIYDGRHVFGPTLQIGWGAPRNLITLDLALGLTLPEPLRILIIGRVRARLPDEELPLIKLNIDVAGLLDLGAGKFDMEGRLFDSSVSGIGIEGGFAVQMRWGGRNNFAFSVGGLHPGFQPPTGFPELPRAGVSLANSRNFTLQLTGYFAITSNSLQFGAAADLIAQASGYGLEAHLGFDALIVFDPFGLDAQLRASARIFKGSSTLMKLGLRGRLRGPGPWSVNGSVTFEILFIDIEIGFSKTFGDASSRPAERINVKAIIDAALNEPIRWAASGSGPVLARPKANGLAPAKEIRFSQDLLPFDTELEHFGGLQIAGPRRFTMTAISLAGQPVDTGPPPENSFAPGTYLALKEKERLIAPAYENLPSGGIANTNNAVADGAFAERNMARRVVLIDAAPGKVMGPETREQTNWIPPDLKPAPLPPRSRGKVGLRQERFVGGTIDTYQGGAGSYTAARAAGLDDVMRYAEL